MRKVFLLTVLLLVSYNCYSQSLFPFNMKDEESSILAFWYNCKYDSIKWIKSKDTTYLNSTLQVYGPVLADSFLVEAEVYISSGNKVYSNKFKVKKDINDKNYELKIIKDYFRITIPVHFLNENPEKIKITISSQGKEFEKWISCEYHKLYGYISDFKGHPLKSFILIKPDAFNTVCGVWSDSNGYYEIYLPERTYNCFYVNDGNYRVSTLEAWAWHMIVDEDQQLDYKIGTGEVYNLNIWSNNGGSNTYLISFRPMVLFHTNKSEEYEQLINNKKYNIINISPDLKIKDITVKINGKESEIYSVQKFFETGKNNALPSYLIQVRRNYPCFGKQTITVEYNKLVEINGEKIFQNSMGYFQFYLNFDGLSKYN